MPWVGRLLVFATILGSVWGVLVVGPKFVRSNQEYSVIISNFYSNVSKVNLLLRMEGVGDGATKLFSIQKQVDVRRYMNRIVSFDIPTITSLAIIKFTINGLAGFNFYEKQELYLRTKSIAGLIQIDKPVFKPGDTMKFRAIVLDHGLKPPANVELVNVTVSDPYGTVVRTWLSANLYAGVFENHVQIPLIPILGTWKISVLVEGESLVSKLFEVKEYVLSTFDVHVTPIVIPLEEHQGLSLKITANYPFGRPVTGEAKVELYLEDDKLDQRKVVNVNGMGKVELNFTDTFEMAFDQQNVLVKVTFIEQHTNRAVVEEQSIAVYKYPYRADLIKETPQFRPGNLFKCTLKLSYHDGSPVSNVPFNVEVEEHGEIQKQTRITQRDGTIKLEMVPETNTEAIDITVTQEGSPFTFMDRIDKVASISSPYLRLKLKSPINLGKIIRLMAVSNERMTFFVYYVIAEGNILDAGFMRPNRQTKYLFQINALEKMIPKATILIATVSNNVLVWDSLEINLEQFGNELDISIGEKVVEPGTTIKVKVNGRPGTYVALAAYDKSLIQLSKHHDVFWDNVIEAFDEFHAIDPNEFDPFYSMGLFARILGGYKMDVNPKLAKYSHHVGSRPHSGLITFRTNFQESWLWKNVSLGRTGSIELTEVVPDTTTSWYLTGFSIDPMYGLAIIKKPIEFTTTQPFYIVENLPYSLKRGEVAALQFTLFNNLGVEYVADVTLYNVANQIEFVGQPLESSNYTKSVSVPPYVGVPISFLVKPLRLGEMAVRVKASMMLGLETDALQKMIRVIPESLVQQKVDSRFFCHDLYKSINFNISLDVEGFAHDGSQTIEFRLNPNLLSTFSDNLDALVQLPTGSGEQNMVHMAPHIVVLDYLSTIGSTGTQLVNKATNQLRQGYQNQMRYRQKDGSFGVWQNDSSVFVTAFVATSMQSSAKYIAEVDGTMVDKAFEWLVSKQHSSGRFDEVGSVFYKELQGSSRHGVALTSYVLVALQEHEKVKVKHAEVIDKGMSYLSNKFSNINNTYDLALATYAMMLNGHNLKNDALEKLIDMSISSENSTERYWNTTNSIETTAYALLSIVLAKKYEEGLPIMRWMVNQQSATGGYPGTQNTFIGLKALTKLTAMISPARNDYTIQLKLKNNTELFTINSKHQLKVFKKIEKDTKYMEVRVDGLGFGLLQVIYPYRLDLKNFEHRFNLTLERQNTSSDYALRLRVCANYIPMSNDERSNMALIEVNFPSGYVVERNPISEQTTVNPIKNIEIRNGSTSVVVYYNNMGVEPSCFTATAYKRFKVAHIRQAHITVYDYYNPKLNAVKVYEVDQLNVYEVCKDEDC